MHFLADTIAPATPLDFIQWGGVIAVLILDLLALVNGWVHTRSEYNAVSAERDAWKEAALSKTSTMQQAATAASDTAQVVESMAQLARALKTEPEPS